MSEFLEMRPSRVDLDVNVNVIVIVNVIVAVNDLHFGPIERQRLESG